VLSMGVVFGIFTGACVYILGVKRVHSLWVKYNFVVFNHITRGGKVQCSSIWYAAFYMAAVVNEVVHNGAPNIPGGIALPPAPQMPRVALLNDVVRLIVLIQRIRNVPAGVQVPMAGTPPPPYGPPAWTQYDDESLD
jgi:hypothetical protein